MWVRRYAAALLVASIIGAVPIPASARVAEEPPWQRRIDGLIGERRMSVSIGEDGAFWYRHLGWVKRAPASNEKLLLSMALLAALGPDRVITTKAMARVAPIDGVIDGNLWLVGRGDPEVTQVTLDGLAGAVAAAGVTRITGSVIGDTGPFKRDWWADGWKANFPADEVALPTALTFRGNVGPDGRHISDPELRAATYLTKSLRRLGIAVTEDPVAALLKHPLTKIATTGSASLVDILRRMDVGSINFDAEVLGKLLGAETSGNASIAGAASAIDAFAAANGAPGFEPYDASGLSFADRVTTQGMVRLLWRADLQPWAPDLRLALPTGGQGTLEGRLGHLRVRAKTGTLTGISALSGWVWSDKAGGWVEFSILSEGMSKDEAVRIEDAIVRIVSSRATAPQ
jgi:D-alanyl-D-alanine carboxypeptidase/D-alanyl-D-alanine-endopeptidase (penicillin-binding protein 4)